MNYICKNPVVIIIFNRPQYTQQVFEQIRKVKPSKFYIIADGPRKNCKADIENVALCREIANNVDWPCETIPIFSDCNLGCKKRVITGLNQVFLNEESAIILEDDCVPSEAFFEFCDWGLSHYREETNVGIISGSNLLDYMQLFELGNESRAGFSMYINCWGWATWKRTWLEFDSYLSIQELNQQSDHILEDKPLDKIEKILWKGIFRHAIYSRTIWDFYLQYLFFKNSFVSVYPKYNLVKNIGFSADSTHTINMPEFVKKSMPKDNKIVELMQMKEPDRILINMNRDEEVIRTIYGYSKFGVIKLTLGNLLRYIGIL